jgi:hypothetical protein
MGPSRSYFDLARAFESMPYKSPPFNGRSWGSPLHSLCSYQGKLKPSIAHFLITNFTQAGETVLDPLAGAGTIPLEAMLGGRRALANDLQELGYILSSAKVAVGDHVKIQIELEAFLRYVEDHRADIAPSLRMSANFGMNGQVKDYFESQNLNEVLAGRQYISENFCITPERAIVYSSFLHVLHGNRPYALSRTSHPVTPFKPSGDFEYRDFPSRVRAKVDRAIGAFPLFDAESIRGSATLGSFETLPFEGTIDAVITSPPFANSTRFYVANWMRLWATGWDADDFHTRKFEFIEEKQRKEFRIYETFFESCVKWLKPNGRLVLHLGKSGKVDMAVELLRVMPDSLKLIHQFDENVVGNEKFGIRDQGVTSTHQFLFIEKRS